MVTASNVDYRQFEVHRIYTCRNRINHVNMDNRHVRIDYLVTVESLDDLIVSTKYETMDGVELFNVQDIVNRRCDECQQIMESADVSGIMDEDRKCDGRCLRAHGPLCICGCGGKNHGWGWIMKLSN